MPKVIKRTLEQHKNVELKSRIIALGKVPEGKTKIELINELMDAQNFVTHRRERERERKREEKQRERERETEKERERGCRVNDERRPETTNVDLNGQGPKNSDQNPVSSSAAATIPTAAAAAAVSQSIYPDNVTTAASDSDDGISEHSSPNNSFIISDDEDDDDEASTIKEYGFNQNNSILINRLLSNIKSKDSSIIILSRIIKKMMEQLKELPKLKSALVKVQLAQLKSKKTKYTWQCPYCFLKFSRKTNLNRHIYDMTCKVIIRKLKKKSFVEKDPIKLSGNSRYSDTE